jgi:chromatin remodeling complex protein RSC6
MFPDIKIDENLKRIVGNKEILPTTEFIKAIWKYVKDNDLKIPKKK